MVTAVPPRVGPPEGRHDIVGIEREVELARSSALGAECGDHDRVGGHCGGCRQVCCIRVTPAKAHVGNIDAGEIEKAGSGHRDGRAAVNAPPRGQDGGDVHSCLYVVRVSQPRLLRDGNEVDLVERQLQRHVSGRRV
eukprot:176100-Prymnesium_polylepis.1